MLSFSLVRPLAQLPDTSLSPTLTLLYKVTFILVYSLFFLYRSLRYLCTLYHGTRTAIAARSNMRVSTVGVFYPHCASTCRPHMSLSLSEEAARRRRGRAGRRADAAAGTYAEASGGGRGPAGTRACATTVPCGPARAWPPSRA